MNNLIKLIQHPDSDVSLTVYRGASRYTQRLTSEEAMTLSNQLQSFAKAQQDAPFYLLRK
jgi:hypothetical protein